MFAPGRGVFEEFPARGQLHDHALEKIGSRAVIQRMKTALLQLLAATADDPSVHIGHGLEKGGVKFDGMFRFREGEFRNRGVKLKLQAL